MNAAVSRGLRFVYSYIILNMAFMYVLYCQYLKTFISLSEIFRPMSSNTVQNFNNTTVYDYVKYLS